jgi:hypothetical protein
MCLGLPQISNLTDTRILRESECRASTAGSPNYILFDFERFELGLKAHRPGQ